MAYARSRRGRSLAWVRYAGPQIDRRMPKNRIAKPTLTVRPDFLREPRTAANTGERPRKRWALRDGVRLCSRLFVGLRTARGPQWERNGPAKRTAGFPWMELVPSQRLRAGDEPDSPSLRGGCSASTPAVGLPRVSLVRWIPGIGRRRSRDRSLARPPTSSPPYAEPGVAH